MVTGYSEEPDGGDTSPDIKLMPALHRLLTECAGPGCEVTYQSFVADAIRRFLPRPNDVFAVRERQKGSKKVRPTLSTILADRVGDLSTARKVYGSLQRRELDATGKTPGPLIAYDSKRSIYEEVIARKIAADYKSLGFSDKDRSRIQKATGYDPGLPLPFSPSTESEAGPSVHDDLHDIGGETNPSKSQQGKRSQS